MNQISTDKKLELIKAIRMQNHYDRQLFRMREGILYSDDPAYGRGELPGLEAAEKGALKEGKNRTLAKFRIRFMIALMLFFFFLLCDRTQISFGNENSHTFYERIKSSAEVEMLIDKIK